mmetsp:Transcript_15595/g.26850  ORF Transcript_15595/g.26850 Transcript_15595/m.26850 type:complete len:276 (+) Transcript_15595:1939-2766(+)
MVDVSRVVLASVCNSLGALLSVPPQEQAVRAGPPTSRFWPLYIPTVSAASHPATSPVPPSLYCHMYCHTRSSPHVRPSFQLVLYPQPISLACLSPMRNRRVGALLSTQAHAPRVVCVRLHCAPSVPQPAAHLFLLRLSSRLVLPTNTLDGQRHLCLPRQGQRHKEKQRPQVQEGKQAAGAEWTTSCRRDHWTSQRLIPGNLDLLPPTPFFLYAHSLLFALVLPPLPSVPRPAIPSVCCPDWSQQELAVSLALRGRCSCEVVAAFLFFWRVCIQIY